MTERLEATVRGSVQGVGFRWFVQRTAQRLALAGWTANAEDGSVSVVAEGPAEKLDELMAALHQGPSGAKVTRVETTRVAATAEFSGFSIKSGAHRGD